MTLRAPYLPPIAALLALTACGGNPASGGSKSAGDDAKRDEAPPLVRVAALEQHQVRREIETTGYLEAEFQVTVQAEVTGRIVEVPVDEGMDVVKGETILARLDDREARAALQQLVVQKAAAEVDQNAKDLAIRSAERELKRATIEKNKAKAEYDRNAEIAQGIVSGKVLDDARFAWEAAIEAEQVAELTLESSRLEATRAENTVADFTAKIEEAQLRLDRHTVLAPLTGIVSKRNVTGGEIVGASTELFEVVDPRQLVAYVNQPQRNLGLVRNAKEVAFTTDTWPDEEFIADVETRAPVVDRDTGSFTMRIRVREGDAERLLPGMFFKAKILAEDLREALMVPKQAVLNNGDLTVVYAVRDGKAYEVDVDPGIEKDDWVECRNRGDSGLRHGDVVVVSGQDDLRDQQQVEVAPPEGESARAASAATPDHGNGR